MNDTPTPTTQPITFAGLGIAPALMDLLGKMKFTTPTPIQRQAIPVANEGKDVLGIAQTGTGKTLAFGLPLIQRLLQVGSGRALVLVPTRELALQVDDTLRRLGQPFHIQTVILIGGMNMGAQIHALRKAPTRVLIATPGRLLDHLNQKTVQLNDMKVVVLDEADRMLDMGFAPQIQKISKFLPRERQTLFFSATMPEEILKIASEYMKLPIRIEIARPGTAAEQVAQELFIVPQDAKRTMLLQLLAESKGSVLVFTRTKMGAKKTTRALRDANHPAAEIHSDRSLGQRREALDGFKTGRYRILVATDIAARGIDVKGIELVINYDLPDDVDNYVHRIGRTGRAGLEGRAVTLATPDQGGQVRDIERLTRRPLKISQHPTLPPQRFTHDRPAPSHSNRPGGHRPSGNHRHGGPPRHSKPKKRFW